MIQSIINYGLTNHNVASVLERREDCMKLLLKAFIKGLMGLISFYLLLFLPAGSLYYPGAWLLMLILFIPMLILGMVMFIKTPELLKKRLNTNEGNSDQKVIILLSALLFVAVFVVSGLDFRFGWSHFPLWMTICACVIFLFGYGIYVEVMRENAYLSRTVEVQEGQKVIDTGLYGAVRHPMYSSTILLFLSMPLILDSLYAFLIMLICYPPIIAWRMKDEEKTLMNGLPGYGEYMKKVKYRVIPYIW